MQLPRAEVGQGITTAIAMILAEELDADLDEVDMHLQDATPANLFNQITGGSTSISVLYEPVRDVAAAMRARLVTAAAQRWDLPPHALTTEHTSVRAPDGRSATYGELAAAAAHTAPAISPVRKNEADFHTIGQPKTRIDARNIVTGKAQYAMDLDVAGAKPTVVARPPAIGGTVRTYNATAAMPGVLAVAPIPSGIAVVAETFHHAQQACDALTIQWDPGPAANVSDQQIRTQLANAAPPFLIPPLTPYVDGTFNFAFVSHAPSSLPLRHVLPGARGHQAGRNVVVRKEKALQRAMRL